MKKDERVLSKVAIAVAAGSVLVVAATLVLLFVQARRAGDASAVAPAYAVGDSVDLPRSMYDASPYTLVVFARSSCAGCQNAKPFLSRLTAQVGAAPDVRALLVTGGRDQPAEVSFASEIGLSAGAVAASPPGIRLHSVPTLLLVDREGTIRYAIEGIPSESAAREEVLRAVGRVSSGDPHTP